MDLNSCKNLQNFINSDNTIELIEIWANVLYIRRNKGRNSFYSKKGITTLNSGIYINIYNFSKNEYKRLQSKYHPDRNPKYLHISKGINQWKDILSRCEYRVKNRNFYTVLIATYSKDTSIYSIKSTITAFSMEQASGLFDGLKPGSKEYKEAEGDLWEWAEGWNEDNYEQKIAEQRAESQRWWRKELLRQRGRDEEGNKIIDIDDGTLPF